MSGTEIQPNRLSLEMKVSLVTSAQYRYEGTVAAINSIEGTLTLKNVRFWGSKNRMTSTTLPQSGDSKPPPIGSMFDSITFWMSSIVQLWSMDEDKTERAIELSDNGVAKAGVVLDANRGRGRRSRNWWPAGDQRRTNTRNSPTNSMDTAGPVSVPVGRYVNPANHPVISNQPRMLVSYPRRGRSSGGLIPRQASYVPIVPIVSGPAGIRRANYGPSLRGPPSRTFNAPIIAGPGGPRLSGRKSVQPIRRGTGGGDDRRYNQGGINPSGGMFVYLPPEMAAAYQSHGINLVPVRPPVSRRRASERRGNSREPSSVEPANAELEAELAKMTTNVEGTSATSNTQVSECGAEADGNATASTGDGHLSAAICSPSTAVSAGSGNGASGDSSIGAVTSTVSGNGLDGATNGSAATVYGTTPLAKGEYYVREKCFFDQISRSEGGSRGPYSSTGGRGTYNQSGYGGGGPAMGYAPGNAARRERQLNMETFGPMAVRTTFTSRRRPSGSGPREFLVSASA
ncbi:unnamed protein product [Dicrocoelium dendriticum]|nr:unnamed protein product [Dicrocoelium dendriticum]